MYAYGHRRVRTGLCMREELIGRDMASEAHSLRMHDQFARL